MSGTLDICCAILAGGRSARMGSDKAMVSIGGEPMLHRAVRLANEICARTVVVGRPQPTEWPAELHATFMEDIRPGFEGPMTAIRSALVAVGGDILVIACDQPLLSLELLRALYLAHYRSDGSLLATIAAVSHPTRGILPEPLLAIYTPQIVPQFDEWLRHDRRSLQQCINLPDVETWRVPEDLAEQLLNVNDPQALADAREKLKAPGGDRPASGT